MIILKYQMMNSDTELEALIRSQLFKNFFLESFKTRIWLLNIFATNQIIKFNEFYSFNCN